MRNMLNSLVNAGNLRLAKHVAQRLMHGMHVHEVFFAGREARLLKIIQHQVIVMNVGLFGIKQHAVTVENQRVLTHWSPARPAPSRPAEWKMPANSTISALDASIIGSNSFVGSHLLDASHCLR